MGMSQEVAAYCQTAVEASSPVELVIILCDSLVRDLKRAVAAIRAGDIEGRVRESNHAFLVLQELEVMLDFENGGETAKELARVYSHVRAKVMETQFKQDPAILERQIQLIQQIRDAWQNSVIALNQSAASSSGELPAFAPIAANPYAGSGEEAQSSSWSA
jgi:flagellar protein FliS